ncbi:hypothetical protein [Paludisphaera borealis]|uniref:Secreted protein n=1 Tax=Paludisphaera borealis TaxID=1387353 RepID=A0A1U7CVJ5_9BACT|nr:hypothetical protein [Paludisphaera borealis]APW62909.1 hypothetical protein BSF38_04465 [Paludisphaera borealis]
MHAHILRTRGLVLAVPSVLVIAAAVGSTPVHGDDSGILGRFFRLGGSSSSSSSRARSNPAPSAPATPSALPYGGSGNPNAMKGNGGAFIPPASPRAPAATPTTGPITEGPSTPEVTESGVGLPAVAPRPRVSNAATSAEPLLTRMALGRSNDGSQFGMFLQIYADGTVIDSEGVHRLSPSDLKPIADLVNSGELGRLRGHCGNPSSDFIEEVHVIAYERRLGRLAAVPFSYSGNPQGCDHAVKQLHTLVENLQTKLSRQPVATAPAVGAPSLGAAVAAPGPAAIASGAASPALAPTGPVIPLTPIDPHAH